MYYVYDYSSDHFSMIHKLKVISPSARIPPTDRVLVLSREHSPPPPPTKRKQVRWVMARGLAFNKVLSHPTLLVLMLSPAIACTYQGNAMYPATKEYGKNLSVNRSFVVGGSTGGGRISAAVISQVELWRVNQRDWMARDQQS